MPVGERMKFGSDKWQKAESRGIQELAHTGFVLVAGGLGERLEYNGIKIALPVQITTGQCYLGMYVSTILAYQDRAKAQTGKDVVLPLFIMTSARSEISRQTDFLPWSQCRFFKLKTAYPSVHNLTTHDCSTHELTMSLLAKHKNFGMADGQITCVKQEMVAVRTHTYRHTQNIHVLHTHTHTHTHNNTIHRHRNK